MNEFEKAVNKFLDAVEELKDTEAPGLYAREKGDFIQQKANEKDEGISLEEILSWLNR